MGENTATKVGHGLAKALGIKLQYRNPTGDDLSRGESVYSASTADTYMEQEPSALDWLREVAPTSGTFLRWAYNLFPFVHWIAVTTCSGSLEIWLQVGSVLSGAPRD